MIAVVKILKRDMFGPILARKVIIIVDYVAISKAE